MNGRARESRGGKGSGGDGGEGGMVEGNGGMWSSQAGVEQTGCKQAGGDPGTQETQVGRQVKHQQAKNKQNS